MAEISKCVNCGKRVKRGMVKEELNVADVTFKAELPAQICTSCESTYASSDVLERFELTVAVTLGKLGVRTPAAFKFMRKALGLKSAELAQLLHVAPETISRWETGARDFDFTAFTLLGVMAAEKLEGRELTREMLKVREHANTNAAVHVKVA